MTLLKLPEFVDIAIKDEETGVAFYRSLAENTANEKLKSEYLRISKQEEYHRDQFKKMLEELGSVKVFEEYPNQYDEYLRTMLEDRAFTTPEQAAEKAKQLDNDKKGVMSALKMEKDTLIFYYELKDFVPSTHKEKIEQIINEERMHIRDLTMLKKQVVNH